MSRVAAFWRLPLSRKGQYLGFRWSGLLTTTVYRARLRHCGRGSVVRPPLFWTPEYLSIGSGVLLWDGCRIEAIERQGEGLVLPHIVLGDGVSMQQNCHVVAAGELSIGAGTTVSFGVMITDVDHGHEQVGTSVLAQPLKQQRTSIGRHCFIGAGARLMAGSVLGDNCIVGANAVVRGHFDAGCVIVGVPARVVKRFNESTGQWVRVDPQGKWVNE